MDIRAGETERDGQRLRLPGGERGWLLGQSSRERAGQTRVQDEPGWPVAAPRMEGKETDPDSSQVWGPEQPARCSCHFLRPGGGGSE